MLRPGGSSGSVSDAGQMTKLFFAALCLASERASIITEGILRLAERHAVSKEGQERRGRGRLTSLKIPRLRTSPNMPPSASVVVTRDVFVSVARV